MVAKAVILFCAQAFLAQCVFSQCLRGYNGIVGEGLLPPFAGPCRNAPYIAEAALISTRAGPLAAERAIFRPSSGGGFSVTSVSPIPVTGISMTSENVYEGPLTVSGTVPFLGGVALEGGLPTIGAGAVAYGCGNGNVAMLSEGIDGYNPYTGRNGYGAGIVGELGYGYAPLALEAGIAGPGYGYGYNRGCGCGALY